MITLSPEVSPMVWVVVWVVMCVSSKLLVIQIAQMSTSKKKTYHNDQTHTHTLHLSISLSLEVSLNVNTLYHDTSKESECDILGIEYTLFTIHCG